MPSRKSTVIAPPGAGKLAPGHRLPREIVAASQRERMIIATTELVQQQGYPATSVAQVTRRASVSRAAFYEHFANKEECFMATYEAMMARGGARILAAYRAPDLDWRERLRAALDAYLHHAQAWPQGMHICIADATSAGPRALALRNETMLAAQRMTERCLSEAPDHTPLSPNLTRALVGGIFRVTYALVRDQRAQELPEMLDEIEGWMLACRHPPVRSAKGGERGSGGRTKQKTAAASRRKTTAGERAENAPAQVPAYRGDSPAEEQRARIVDAVVELCSSTGYAEMTHQQIAARAGVSYTTFYKHFENKQEALLAAYDAGSQRIVEAVVLAAAAAADWPTALRDGLGAALQAMTDAPAFARVRVIEITKLGPAGFQRIDATLAGYDALLAPGYEQVPGRSRILTEAIFGAITEVIYYYTSLEREDELPTLVGELTYIALAPFLGAEEAARIAVEGAGG
jgi:AcrR family transcriptional regulator